MKVPAMKLPNEEPCHGWYLVHVFPRCTKGCTVKSLPRNYAALLGPIRVIFHKKRLLNNYISLSSFSAERARISGKLGPVNGEEIHTVSLFRSMAYVQLKLKSFVRIQV